MTKLQKIDHQGPGLPPEIPVPGAKPGDDEADDVDSQMMIFVDEHEVPPPKFLEGVWQWPEEGPEVPRPEDRRPPGPEDDPEWQRTQQWVKDSVEPEQERRKRRKPRHQDPLPVLAPQGRGQVPEAAMYPCSELRIEPPVVNQAPKVQPQGSPGSQPKPHKRSKHGERDRVSRRAPESPVQQGQPVGLPVSTQPVQGVKRTHSKLRTNLAIKQPSSPLPSLPPAPTADQAQGESVPHQYTLPPSTGREETRRSTRNG